MVSLLFLVILLLQLLEGKTSSQFKIWGPGLQPQVNILPCRYFYVENTEGESHADSDSQYSDIADTINVTIAGTGANMRMCRPHTEALSWPGGVLVRYKLWADCSNIQISVRISGEHVQGSPVSIEGVTHADSCNCPRQTLEEWIVENSCPVPSKQMDEDLKQFEDGIDMRVALEKARTTFSHRGSQCWCHYAVKNGQIYRKCYGQHVGFNMFWDNLLNWLARRSVLPDLEMLVNLGDWPLVTKAHRTIPMFSWCGSHSTHDMVFPTYELTEASLECMGRQSLDVLSAMSKNQVPWDQKIEKLFWRGRDSRRERLKLVELAKEYPDAINASITAYFFFREEEKRLGKSPYFSFFDFFDHKYQLNIDGTVAAYRLPYLLAGGGVVFKQESPYYEHFYSGLQPWVHYIPVAQDLSDLLDRIDWVRENDQEAKQISEAALQFAKDHLLPQNVLCYHAQMLARWARLIKNKVEVREGMEKVEQIEKTEGRFSTCTCPDIIVTRSDVKDEL